MIFCFHRSWLHVHDMVQTGGPDVSRTCGTWFWGWAARISTVGRYVYDSFVLIMGCGLWRISKLYMIHDDTWWCMMIYNDILIYIYILYIWDLEIVHDWTTHQPLVATAMHAASTSYFVQVLLSQYLLNVFSLKTLQLDGKIGDHHTQYTMIIIYIYYTYIPTYLHTYLHTYIPTYLHTYITYIPTYLHTYIHYIYIYKCSLMFPVAPP